MPDVVGAQQGEAERELEEREFVPEVERTVSERPPGTVVAQRPEAGTLYGEGGIVVLAVARDPLRTEVPDVSGLTTPRALARLRAAELRPRAQAVQSQEPKGTVLRQLPPGDRGADRFSRDRRRLFGPDVGTVPDVVGTPRAGDVAGLAGRLPGPRRARRELGRGGVGRGAKPGRRRSRESRDRRPAERVARVGRLHHDRDDDPSQAAVPDTVGQDEATAQATLEGAGFVARVVDQPTTSAEEDGIVVRQAPAGDGSARTGSTVMIFVGRLS